MTTPGSRLPSSPTGRSNGHRAQRRELARHKRRDSRPVPVHVARRERSGRMAPRGRRPCLRPVPSQSWRRPINDRADSQLRPPGQPPTLGGLKRSWPSRAAQSARTSVLGGGSSSSRARTAPTVNSTGPCTRVPRLAGAKNARESKHRGDGPTDVELVRPQTVGQRGRSPASSRPLRPSAGRRFARPAARPSPGCSRIIRTTSAPRHFPVLPRIVLAPSSCRDGASRNFAVGDVPAGQGPRGLPYVGFGVSGRCPG